MSKINLPGRVGDACEIGNAHTIEITRNSNGSGNDCFGGAREWPAIYAEIQFQAHEQRRAIDFAKKLSNLIKEEFG